MHQPGLAHTPPFPDESRPLTGSATFRPAGYFLTAAEDGVKGWLVLERIDQPTFEQRIRFT